MQSNLNIVKSVIDSLEHVVLIVDQDGKLAAVNEFALNLFPDEPDCIGRPIWSLKLWGNNPTSGQAWKRACQRAAQGARIKFVDEIKYQGDEKLSINFTIAPIKDEADKITFLLVEVQTVPFHSGAFTREKISAPAPSLLSGNYINDAPATDADIQTSNNANSALVNVLKTGQQFNAWLLDSENRFRLMVESIEDYAMFMVDLDGFIISWNRGAERLTGYADIEAIGRHFSMLYPKEELDRDHAVHELMMAQLHGRYEEEGIRVRKNGTHYNAQIIVWRIDNSEGNTVGFAKITRDISLRKMAERALKDSEAKFKTMTDAMPQMVWSALPNGQQDYINQQWFHFTGSDKKAALRGGWLDLVHPDDKNQVAKAWQHSLASGENFEGQFRLLHMSNTYRWTLGRALPVRDEQEKIIRWMGTLTDIHEQKRAETTLYESARRKDEYLAMLAHELRNPLAPIRNSTELLRRLCNADNAIMGSLEVIDRQVVHMTRLIDDLLDVARISRGKIELRRETFELGELIRHTTSDFSSGYHNKNVNLRVEVPESPVWLYADRTRIAQAIGNLLHNALKFTEAQGEVCISLSVDVRDGKSFGVIKVKDSGIGIDPTLLEQLFEPFVQGDQGLARSKGGLGLGLALIKGFANLHGGKVEARSAGTGSGSEFIFQIPLSASLVSKLQADPIARNAGPLKVVLIDDNRDMVETLAMLLSLDGHEIKCAYDGESGLDLIKSEQPDLVFCDIGLPGGLDGYAIARGVREDTAINKTFMVALSGYGQEKDKKLAFECGFDDHLLKPIDFKGLAAMINAAEYSSHRAS
jgi:PAS domain S-box-containing protein